MPTYRFYPLDRTGGIAAPAADHDLPDDGAACERAQLLVSRPDAPHSVQVWQGQRLVHCAARELETS